MIPIKIQCGCGQRYAFDVEPDRGCMPYPVACPVCGVDGTAAANAFLAQVAPAPAEAPLPVAQLAPAKPVARIHVRTPQAPVPTAPAVTVAPRAPVSHMPPIDRPRVLNEARAKIFWGDPPKEVVKYLMMQGIDYEEASVLVRAMHKERQKTLRGIGLQKTVCGAGLVCVPIVAWVIFMRMGVIPLKLFAITIMAGLWGAWMLLKGSMMLIAPKAETGDVADQ